MTAPDASESWIDPIFDAIISDIQRSGYFQAVQGHEPKSSPKNGLTAAMWFLNIRPIPEASGLAVTSARIEFIVRLYQNMLKEPQDLIDPDLLRACSNLIRQWHDDFDFSLTEIVRNVDVLGAHGEPLRAVSGYIDQDGGIQRMIDIFLPVIVNDVWPQVS